MTNSVAESLIAGSFVGGTAAYLGSLMITQRMALVGDALGHVALPGMGLALLFHFDVSLGAFISLGIGILFIWKLVEETALSVETLVGITFVSSLALGFLIVPQPELLETLIGDISDITQEGTLITVLISLVVIVLVRRIYRGMMLLNISEDLATVEGISRKRHYLIFLVAIALIVSLGIKVTGSLLVGALVIIPPATARILSTHLSQYSGLSIWIGVLDAVVGILVSVWSHSNPGPMIILTSAVIFLFAAILKRARR